MTPVLYDAGPSEVLLCSQPEIRKKDLSQRILSPVSVALPSLTSDTSQHLRAVVKVSLQLALTWPKARIKARYATSIKLP